jgi:hypothetical protein
MCITIVKGTGALHGYMHFPYTCDMAALGNSQVPDCWFALITCTFCSVHAVGNCAWLFVVWLLKVK